MWNVKDLIFPIYLRYVRSDGVSGITLVKDRSDLEERMKTCEFVDIDMEEVGR